MGEGVVFWKGFAFKANCGGCGGLVTHPVLWIPEMVAEFFLLLSWGRNYLRRSARRNPGGADLWGWNSRHSGALQHGWGGDFYPNKRICLYLCHSDHVGAILQDQGKGWSTVKQPSLVPLVENANS